MLSDEVKLNDYYGYNSIIDGQGKRIRRMRRTQASAQKLMYERVKSPCLSRDPSNRSRASPIQHSRLSSSIIRCDSGLKFHREKITSQKIQNKRQEYYSGYNVDTDKSKRGNETPSNHHQKTVGNVNDAISEYFLWNQQRTMEKQTKQPLKPFRSYQREAQSNAIRPSQSRDGFGNMTVRDTSRRTLKKTEKTYEIRPFQLQQNPKRLLRNQLKQQPPPSLLKKRQSNIQSNVSKSNNGKLSEVSSASKKNSRISQSVVSNSQRLNSRPHKKNNVKFDQQLMESGDFRESNSINDHYSQKQSVSERSSVNIDLPSQTSQSHIGSRISSSYASSLRSKIKKSQQRSKISNLIENGQEIEVNSPLPRTKVGKMAKKSTQTTQSDENNKKISQAYKAPKRFVQDHEAQQRSLASSSQRQSHLKPDGSNVHAENQQSSYQSYMSKRQSRHKPQTQQKNMRFSMSSSNHRHGQLQQSLKVQKKKSASSYTFNDVAQNIEEHDIRICSIYLFVDSTRSLYETPLKFERYERLCFLMLKKYKNQKTRIVKSLQGDQESCFILMDAEIPSQALTKHINRLEIRQRLNTFMEQQKKISRQVEDFYNDISRKYQKDKYIKLETSRYAFEPEIMRLLMEELNKLYQELQKEDIENDIIDSNELRIIEIVEIMFLMSELNGRFVKRFQLFDENQVDFQDYYAKHYEKIMQTAEYFEKQV